MSSAQAHRDEERDPLTERVLGAAFEVSNHLGHGFLEAVYQKALLREIGMAGLHAHKQVGFRVHYKGEMVGWYYADIVVERRVVIELKAVTKLTSTHVGQVLNYLKASNLRTGLCHSVRFNHRYLENRLEFAQQIVGQWRRHRAKEAQ